MDHWAETGGKPSPKNESALSVITALAIPSVAETMIGDRIEGRICREMIRRAGVPIERAASTNSRSLIESTSLVFAYGLDVFGTRLSPSFSFDILGKNFNKFQMLATVAALAVATFLVAPLVCLVFLPLVFLVFLSLSEL